MRRLLLPALVLLAGAAPSRAVAKPNVNRKGGQWGLTAGAAMCVPSKVKCKHSQAADLGAGRTRASFGLGAELGYRWEHLFLGAAYNLGLMRADYDTINDSPFKNGYQNSVFAVIRPMLTPWRFDLGLDFGVGFGRQTYKRDNGEKNFSQGLTFKTGPVVDIFVARRIFVGLKLDLILNAHGKTCVEDAGTRTCAKKRRDDIAGSHQTIFGLHVGGTFP